MDSRVFRTAIIGLGRSDVLALHQVLDNLSADHQFEWVNADHPQLDFLLINNFFINSSSIKKIIETHQAPFLIVERQDRQASIDGNTLYLPLKETHSLLQWVLNNLRDNSASSISHALNITSSSARAATVLKELAANSANASKPQQHSVECSEKSSLVQMVHDIVELKQGKWLLSDARQVIGLIDIPNNLVWTEGQKVLSELEVQLPLQLKQTSEQLPNANATCHDLRQWLWQLAWHCKSESMLLPKRTMVKIKLWPQPFDPSVQQLLLKGCAFLKYQATSAEQLSQSIRISLLEAQKLLTSMVAVDFAEEVMLSVQQQGQVATAVPVAANGALKGFLSKLRHKLGF